MLATTGSASAVEPSIFQKVYGPFDFTQGSYAVAVAELVEVQGSLAVQMSAMTGSVSAVEPSIFQKVCGPFDTAQGSYAVAVAELVEVQGSYFTLGRNFFQVSWI